MGIKAVLKQMKNKIKHYLVLAVSALKSSLLPLWEDQTPQAAAGRGGMFPSPVLTKGPPQKAASSSHPPAQTL